MGVIASTFTVSTVVGSKVTKTVPEKQLLKTSHAKEYLTKRECSPTSSDTQSSELSPLVTAWPQLFVVWPQLFIVWPQLRTLGPQPVTLSPQLVIV